MMPSAWLQSLVAIGISLITLTQTQAQPLFGHAESIETTVANADRVVIGRIVAILGGDQADGRQWTEVTIAVEEVLKEQPQQDEPQPRLRVNLSHPASFLSRWKDQSRRLLVAEREEATTATVIDLDDENLRVLTADLTLLRVPEAVIRAAKEAVRRIPSGVRRLYTRRLEVPREVIAGTDWEDLYETGGYLDLSIPVDVRLVYKAPDAKGARSEHKAPDAKPGLVWEYKTLFLSTKGDPERSLNELGEQGWELVTVARYGPENSPDLMCIFKRARP